MGGSFEEHFLDRIGGRIVAGLVCVAAVSALAAMHWTTISAWLGSADSISDQVKSPRAKCIAQRHAVIAQGVAEGSFGAAQRQLFEQRATAFCVASTPE